MERDEDRRIVFTGGDRPADMWTEFTSARERFFALLARQSAEHRAAAAAGDDDEGVDAVRPPRHLVTAGA